MGADGRNVTSISQPRNISAFVPAWSTVFRESIIELGSVAPSSVANPADAVQIIGGRPVIGSERIRRHDPETYRHSCPRGVRFSENQSSNWGAWRHPASLTLQMRLATLDGAT